MSMQKDIIDKIRNKGGAFLIELKANQRALRYGVEDRIKEHAPRFTYTEGPNLDTAGLRQEPTAYMTASTS